MTSKSNLRFAGWMLAALMSSSAAVDAAGGFTISVSDETAIKTGMSASEVRQRLGTPARAVHYRNAPGPTWTYNVVGAVFTKTEFDIQFGADDKVISMGEQVIIRGSPG